MMIDFDSLDGIQNSINFGKLNGQQQKQRECQLEQQQKSNAVTGKVAHFSSTQQLCRPNSSSTALALVAQPQQQQQQHQDHLQEAGPQTSQKLDKTSVGQSTTYHLLSSNHSVTSSPKLQPSITTNNCQMSSSNESGRTTTTTTTTTTASSSSSTSPPAATTIKWTESDDNLLSCLLITANVGTIFEESTLLELWFQQLRDYLIKIKPRLVAIHCQEVGGKNFETSMKNVSTFTDKILGDQEIIGEYSRVRIFLDDNFDCLEKFTALGSLYLIHDSVQNVKLYNFKTAQYDSIQDRIIHKDNHDQSNTTKTSDSEQNTIAKKTQSPTSVESKSESNNNDIDVTDKPIHQKSSSSSASLSLDCKHLSGPCEHVEKVKFPQDLFPECRWSRKGFMRTRWLFKESQLLDLVNIHLFHDASNLIAMKTTPSPYAQNRQRALEFALNHIQVPLKNQNQPEVPMFIFGDFNFRLDTSKVIEKITEGVSPMVKLDQDRNEVVEFIYHRKPNCIEGSDSLKIQSGQTSSSSKSTLKNDNNENVVMTIGKKLFDCENLDEMFRATKNTEWLQELDIELNSFRGRLHEFKISFSPSYPFKEDESGGYSYMKTRCPAWCDRILFNDKGRQMIFSRSQNSIDCQDSERKIELLQDQGDVIYRLMGKSVPMGDHKPVLLYCQLEMAINQYPSVCPQEQGQQQRSEVTDALNYDSTNNTSKRSVKEVDNHLGNASKSTVALDSTNERPPNGSLIEFTPM